LRELTLLALLLLVGCGRRDQVSAPEFVEFAARGDAARVQALLEDGADVNSRDPSGRTAVTAAVYGGHVAAVRALVEAGADVDLQDDTRANAFLACGETGNVAVLREVLRAEPDLGRTNRFGGTALIPAADHGHVDTVRELLRTEIDVDHVNDLGWTALLEAVILGDGGQSHHQVVRLLIAAGADLELGDSEGRTPLTHARERGHEEIARLLERAGAKR